MADKGAREGGLSLACLAQKKGGSARFRAKYTASSQREKRGKTRASKSPAKFHQAQETRHNRGMRLIPKIGRQFDQY